MEIVMSRAIKVRMVAALAALIASLPCGAQEYPTRPVTMVVAFAPGGFADGIARVLGARLAERLGHNVVIENRGGAGGNIANETLTKGKTFSLDDLAPIAIPAWAPETLSVHPNSPARTLSDLVRIAKDKPISYASPGVGTSGHIANAYFFKNLAKIDAVHVPFQGGAPAVNAMLGGHVDALVGAVPGYAGQ
jgi:tripartite-type tricarboxylate transporter receptor subunit TctC